MWKLSNNEPPGSISEHFQIINKTFGEKFFFKYHVLYAKSHLLKRNIIFQGPRLWNSLKTEHKNKVSPALKAHSKRLFLATENPLKMMKNAYFTLKALFVLKIFKFLS